MFHLAIFSKYLRRKLLVFGLLHQSELLEIWSIMHYSLVCEHSAIPIQLKVTIFENRIMGVYVVGGPCPPGCVLVSSPVLDDLPQQMPDITHLSVELFNVPGIHIGICHFLSTTFNDIFQVIS